MQSICTENSLPFPPLHAPQTLTWSTACERWVRDELWVWVGHLVSPSIPAQCWATRPGCPPHGTGNIYNHCIYFLCCCLLQKQITTNTAAPTQHRYAFWFYTSEVWNSLKSRCLQGYSPFQRAPELFHKHWLQENSVLWIWNRVPSPCLSAESCCHFHSLAYVLFLHFQASYSNINCQTHLNVKRAKGNARVLWSLSSELCLIQGSVLCFWN